MSELLCFRLFGPLASWGEIAVGEVRPTALRPTRSALLGLLAAAMGLRCDHEQEHLALSAALIFAVRIDSPGVPAVDYHTLNHRQPERKERIATRADEVRVKRDLLSTVQSWRHYRCDALVTVAVASRQGEGRFSLGALQAALERPFFPLSLGRKSCVPALPLASRVIAGATLVEALSRYDAASPPALPDWYPARLAILRSPASQACYEVALDLDFPLPLGLRLDDHLVERRDEILSRRRWRFRSRQERVYSVPRQPDAKEEAPDVSQPSLAD